MKTRPFFPLRTVALLALLVLTTQSAQAQTAQPQIGLRAGGNFAQLRGESNLGDGATGRKFGFMVGVSAEMPVSSSLSVQPELLYAQKGGTEDDVDVNLNYLELPVLVKYALPVGGRFVPSLYAGPYAGYSLTREIEIDGGGSESADDFIKRFDYGAVFGVDLGYRFAGRAATVGLRYDLGLANVFDNDFALDGGDEDLDDAELRTHEVSVVLGITLF